MQILNLARKEYGTIDYNIISFPDGQKHLRILSEIDHKEKGHVVCRITNGDDLFLLMQIADIFNRHCIEWSLNIKYLMAARTDRLFTMNDAHSLNIVTNIIQSLGAYKVTVFEPHNNRKLGNMGIEYQKITGGYNLAYPDRGASSRYSHVYGYNKAIICSKVRNELSGALLEFNIDYAPSETNMDILLIDDLCDGGGTFMGLESKLRELNPKTMTLQVGHAIQLEGIRKVASVYDEVIITNSFADWDLLELPSNVIVVDVLKI